MRRLVLLGLLTYGLLFLGLAIRDGRVMALAIPLVIYLGAASLYSPGTIQLSAERTICAGFDGVSVTSGVPQLVKLNITNTGESLEDVLVEDVLPKNLVVTSGSRKSLRALASGETVQLAYTVSGLRGAYDFTHLQVTASNHLGLFQRKADLPAPARLLILPEAYQLRQVAIRPQRTRGYAGPVPARLGGTGVEFFGVREYQAGDSRRWINWRVSARHTQTIFSNEFEQERIADVGIILDARRHVYVHQQQYELFEYAVRAALTLAKAFISDGNRLGLLTYGRSLERTFPGYGKVQHERILQALARAQVGDSMALESLDYLPTRFFPAHSQIVLVSPLCMDDLGALTRLRSLGYQVLVISPDPVHFEMIQTRPSPILELAGRIAFVERELLIRQLLQIGIPVINWQVNQRFEEVIGRCLARSRLNQLQANQWAFRTTR